LFAPTTYASILDSESSQIYSFAITRSQVTIISLGLML